MSSPKVMHIGKYFAPFRGGIENMMYALTRQQVKVGLDVSSVVHHHERGKSISKENHGGLILWRLPIQGVFLFVPLALSAYFSLRKIIIQEKPDVLHCHLPNVTCFWLLFMPLARRMAWVVHWHSDVVGERPHWVVKLLYPIYSIFERALLQRACVIIVTSQNYLQSSRPLQKFRHKCQVVPLGLEAASELRKNPPSQINEPLKKPLEVLCVGRLTYYKGHRFLIDAIKRCKSSVNLTIVGDGEEKETLKQQVRKLELAHVITFKHDVSNEALNLLLSSCDFLVLPSIERTEAFGLVLLEAMRAQKPCICTNVEGSGMSEVITHGYNGLVAKHCNAYDLARCIDLLANSEVLRIQMGENGHRKFVQHYSVVQTTQQINNLYAQCMCKSSNRDE